MDPVRVPLAPKNNLIASTAACPDGGFLYIGFKSVNYISAIKDDEDPIIKTISTRQKIQSIGCDPDWTETKYFAALADDNTIQVWDVEDSKAKRGHKAHIKTPVGDGDGPSADHVAMCFLRNRTILSIDSHSIIKYCVKSNRFTKHKRIINNKHKVIVAKGSIHNDNLIVFGSTRGLIFLVNLENETILSTFCGHTREVTSLSWFIMPAPKQQRLIKTAARKISRRGHFASNATNDDVFDIYDFDYLENEFGVPDRGASKIPSDTESASNDQQDAFSNENFDFIEACKNLKGDILARKDGNGLNDSTAMQSRQVTLEDCQQAIHEREVSGEDQSLECDSELSLEFPDSSQDSLRDCFKNNCTLNSTMSESKEGDKDNVAKLDVYLASASMDGSVWIWDIKTCSSIDQISMKTSHGPGNNNYIEVSWLDANTLIMNDKSCELSIYTSNLLNDKNSKFKREKHETKQRGVIGLCKMIESTVVWVLSSRRELLCEDLITKKVLAKFSCGIAGVSAIRENPGDMNRIAIAFPDRRIGLLPLASVTSKNITIDCWALKEDTQILALCWGPNDRHLAFGTAEGRVGVVDTEKSGSTVVLMKPFSGKPIYSLCWNRDKIFVCSQEKIAYYEWNGKTQHAIKLENITRASSIALRDDILIVGNQIGDIILHVRSEKSRSEVAYQPAYIKNVFTKYIKEIQFNPLNHSRIAVSALSSKVIIMKLADMNLEIEQTLVANENQSTGGNSNVNCIKWSNKNENILLTSGFDGTIRVWDLSQPNGNELIFLKYFDSPMLCALFSPINEDVVICAGRATSIEMFNYKKEVTEPIKKTSKEKNKDKHLGEVIWGTRLENVLPSKKKSKQKHTTEKDADKDYDGMVERLRQLKGDDVVVAVENDGLPSAQVKNTTTIMHLIAKEFNKDVLLNISRSLDDTLDTSILSKKLFLGQEDAEDIMRIELENHEKSKTNSIARILIPQITGNMKEEILECIKSKKLNEFHISLAPTISYDFWKKCCKAYAYQLIEVGLVLNATSYLLACHDIRESIDYLLDKHYYREAWVIGKIYMDSRDPIFDIMLKKWHDHVFSTGNYEGAALLCTLAGDYKGAIKCLLERKQHSDELEQIVNMLEAKVAT